MKKESMVVRGALIVGFATALLLSFGCGGSDTGSGATPPALACSDAGAAAANTVIMSCAGAIDGTTEKVNVVIGGPASGTTTLRGLNFDVTYDPAMLEFVLAATPASPLFQDAFVFAVLANGLQGRVVVAIQQPGDLAPVVVAPGEHDVLSLSFRRVPAATFDPTPLTFERAQATAAVPPVAFTSGLALGYP